MNEDEVRNYIEKNKVRLYILTPCFGNLCYTNYMASLIESRDFLTSYGVQVLCYQCGNDSLVSRARNGLIAKAMADPLMTHCIFIDNDICWDKDSILKLILRDKNIVGGIYPIKKYMWEKLNPIDGNKNIIKDWLEKKNSSDLTKNISDEDFIQSKLLRYNLNYLVDGNPYELQVENGLAKIRYLATGFMMFKREVIELMSSFFPETKYTDDSKFLTQEEDKFAYALFDCAVKNKRYLSEDWLFCERWLEMGGDIYADATINLNHIGNVEFKGSYISSLI